jgi:pimeloyl-ACP methyl ester carboxylesterase
MFQVSQQFVQVGERRVFLRHAGQGPAVVLLHQSPESSLSLLPWFERLAEHFAVFAPDTPGFGQSDPLPLAQPTIPDFAAALAALLDALGIQRVLLYGVHTGAAIAARLARDQPQRIAALVCDGLSAFTPAEKQPLLNGYLPPFEPSWDGGHLLWLWARIREQTLFFPWHTPTAAARIPYPLATPDQIHKSVMEVLDAGDGYRAGYRAALLYDSSAALAPQLPAHSLLLYRRADVLRAHMDRLPPLPAGVQAREVVDAEAMAVVTRLAFDVQAHEATVVDASAAVGAAASPRHRIVATAGGMLAWRCQGALGAEAHVWLGDIGTPAQVPADAPRRLGSLALEWPNHGASGAWSPADLTLKALAQHVQQALLSLGVQRLHVHATGGGCALATQLARQCGAACASLALLDPLPLNAQERDQFLQCLPDWGTQATGAHLLAAWNWLRLKSLFWPWLPQDANAVISTAPPSPHQLHADVVEVLRAGEMHRALWEAVLGFDWVTELDQLALQPTIHFSAGSEYTRLRQRLLPIAAQERT